jgi:hypothetical protein
MIASPTKMPAAAKPEWTPNHDLALAALTSLKVPHKEATALLTSLPDQDPGELLRLALRQRANANKRYTQPGAPQNAAPLHPPPLPSPTKPKVSLRAFTPKPPTKPMVQQQQAQQLPRINLRAYTPGALVQNPAQPAAASPSITTSPAAKPRVRVMTTGQRVPPAPIGGTGAPSPEVQAPTNAPSSPSNVAPRPPVISTDAEFHKLPPGTEFIWAPDFHRYRKESEPVEQKA